MIKVIKPRTRRNVECANCGALLSYEKEDVKEGVDKEINGLDVMTYSVPHDYITCPECGEKIRLRVTR